jgi:hypothetical protein
MPLLGKEWGVIDGGCGGKEGGVIAENFGPSELLNDVETKAALIAADAVRGGNGVLIDSNGEAHEVNSAEIENFETLREIHANNIGSMTPIEEFIDTLLYQYRANTLDAAWVLKKAQALQEETRHLDREFKVIAKKYRRQLEAAIEAADSEGEADCEMVGA